MTREAHSYEYDNNGNILYVNTLRLKPDMTAQPDTVQRARDKRTVPLSHSEMKMHFLKQKTTYISIGPPNFPNYVPVTYNYYNSINTNGAIFNQVMINGKVYIYDSKDHYKSLE